MNRYFIPLTLLVLMLAGCTAPSPTGSNEPPPAITVTGSGEASAPPDIAYVELGIEVTGNDPDEVVADANDRMTGVRAVLTQQGIADKDIQTRQFNVRAEVVRNPQTGELTDEQIFSVSNVVRVTVRDIETTGEVIGAALGAGANTVRSVQFSIEDTTELEAEARQNAINQATARAQQLADGFGVGLGSPITIIESQGGGPVIAQPRVGFDEAAGAVPPISGGELSITISLSVSFSIEP